MLTLVQATVEELAMVLDLQEDLVLDLQEDLVLDLQEANHPTDTTVTETILALQRMRLKGCSTFQANSLIITSHAANGASVT